jgi:hypothetical protein
MVPQFVKWFVRFLTLDNERFKIMITSDQLVQLQQKVADLVAAKTSADAATKSANDAASALVVAQQASSDAASAEATADGQVTADLQDLTSFVDSLVMNPTPATVK